MPITHNPGGSTTLTGDSIDYFQLCTIKGAVGLELKGMKMSRGPVVWKRAREMYNIPKPKGRGKANKQEVYDWLCAKVKELQAVQEHVSTDPVTGREVREVGGQEVQ